MAAPHLPAPPVPLLAAGRVALGAACLAAPGLLVRLLGFPDRSATALTFTRMLGVRDLAAGLALVAAGRDRRARRMALGLAALVDAGDTAAIALAGARHPDLRRAAVRNLPLAGGSALVTLWVLRSPGGA